MDKDCWKMENLCMDLFSPGNENEAEQHPPPPPPELSFYVANEHHQDDVVQRCKPVCDALISQSASSLQTSCSSQQSSPFGTVRYIVENVVSNNGATEDFDVTIIMEIRTDTKSGTPSLAYILNKFYDILIKNSGHLGLDPSFHPVIHLNPPEYVIRFQLRTGDNGSKTVDIRLAQADACFFSV